jgi:hypothetical protein
MFQISYNASNIVRKHAREKEEMASMESTYAGWDGCSEAPFIGGTSGDLLMLCVFMRELEGFVG